MTGTIAAAVLLVVLAIAFLAGSHGRQVPRPLGIVALLMVMYLVVKLLHGLVTMLASSLPWWAAVLLTIVLLYCVMTRGAMNMLAASCEGCANPRERFTGDGSSAGYRFGNFFLTVMISLGAIGMTNFQFVNEIVIIICSVIGTIVCLVAHSIDGRNYGHEPAGQPRSSDDTPTKLYHDFMTQGVLVALHLTTWVPTLVLTVIALMTGQTVTYWPAVGIIITAIVMVVFLAAKHGDIDYAKIHPAPTE